MAAIWSEQGRYQRWLDVEIAVCEVQAERGEIPAEAVEVIRRRAAFDPARIAAMARLRRNGGSFLVAGRGQRERFLTLADLAVPDGFDKMLRSIPEHSFRIDTSSPLATFTISQPFKESAILTVASITSSIKVKSRV